MCYWNRESVQYMHRSMSGPRVAQYSLHEAPSVSLLRWPFSLKTRLALWLRRQEHPERESRGSLPSWVREKNVVPSQLLRLIQNL